MTFIVGQHNSRGFTFLEVLIGGAMVLLITLACVLTLVQGFALIQAVREETLASIELERMLSRLEATPFGELLARFPDGQVVNVESLFGQRVLPGSVVAVDYASAVTGTNPLETTVTVAWSSRGHVLQRSTTTLLHRVP